MREILPEIDRWVARGEPVALATVIRTWGSSSRAVGAKMALTEDGKIAGSVSGGCVEGAVYETGVEVLQTWKPQLLHFGVADETAWQVGLACGGQIDVFVKPLEESMYLQQQADFRSGKSFAVATAIQGPAGIVGNDLLVRQDGRTAGGIGPGLDEDIQQLAQAAIRDGKSQTIQRTMGNEPVEIFIEVVEPQLQLVIVGGVHTAIALTHLARTLGFSTVVVDPRRAFGSPDRFQHADRLIQAWPDKAFEQVLITEKTAIAMLTHDPKIDDPALMIALNSPAFYIGALGSQTTQAKRRHRLLEAGLSEAQLARLHGPIGLKLGGQTPEEIALAILAEIIAVRNKTYASVDKVLG
jgi:xanthine dehydrogenase accessory factor